VSNTELSESEARQVLLLQARETCAAAPGDAVAWSPDDRAWATRQALAAVGEQAPPARFVAARAAIALQRLLPRDVGARRWLEHRGWHPAWVVVALLAGALVGLGIDQLGTPERVNLLAPAVWGVVAWNLGVYLLALLPSRGGLGLLRGALAGVAGLGRRGDAAAAELWAEHAAPLAAARIALVVHAAAAALALGLVGGLYLRGLVLDYRAGWQSTFLDAASVQQALGWGLAPASALTGIAVPEVAPLQLAPGAAATASAAPWIHLFAATLALFVVLPRVALAALAGARASRLAHAFPLPLDTPYFLSLHALMRGDRSPVVRLLWSAPAAATPVTLLGTALPAVPDAPLVLWTSDEGDRLELHPLASGSALAPAAAASPWWRRWLDATPFEDPAEAHWRTLRASTDAVLHVSRPGLPRPGWLATLARPVVVLEDDASPAPPALPLHGLADGWLPDGRLWRALDAALQGDERVARLAAAWERREQQRLRGAADALAGALAAVAATRVPLGDDGLLARRPEAERAQLELAQRLDAVWRDGLRSVAAALGHAPEASVADSAAATAPQALATALRRRVHEGPAAVLGGAVSGALAGLKADVATGGLTMGAGLVGGGVLGALAAAGVARGVNVVRGTDRSFVACDDVVLPALARTGLRQVLTWMAPPAGEVTSAPVRRAADSGAADAPSGGIGEGGAGDAGTARTRALDRAIEAAWAAEPQAAAALDAAWASRSRRLASDGETDRLAALLGPSLEALLRAARASALQARAADNPAP
jgi:hypothetical protein